MRRGIRRAQQSEYDCGAAALCSVTAHYGLHVPLAKARMLCGCTKDGITIKGILEAGAKLGFRCRACKSENRNTGALAKIPLPAIIHTRQENGFFHFITLLKIKGKSYVVMDPAKGEIRELSDGEFAHTWTGYLILFEPDSNFTREDRRGNTFLKLIKLGCKYKKELVHIAIGTITLSFIGICNSIFLQRIIDTAVPQRDIPALAEICCATVALAVTGMFISYSKQIYLSVHGLKITDHLVKGYLEKLVSLPLEFYNHYHGGEINSRISDAFNIRLFLTEGFVSIIVSAATLGIAIPVMFHYNTTLAMMATAFIPIYIIIYLIASPKNIKYNKDLAEAGARFETNLLQCIEGIVPTKRHSAEKWALERMEKSYDCLADQLLKASKAAITLGISTEGLSKGVVTATLVSGTSAVFNNTITVGELVSFYTLCPLFSTPLAGLVNMNPVIAQAKVSAERLFEIMELDNEEECFYKVCDTDRKLGKHTEIKGEQDICIKGLSFSYPGCIPLLENFSCTIKRGKITLLEGAVGTGKSTLASLLMKDYKLEKGNLFYGERDIASIPVREWRKRIAIVPQKCHIFNASILKNIVLDEQEPDMAKVTVTCAKVGIIEKILSLPSSLHTNIGERGIALSGGEMQKIAMARVLYREPEIIIFDEATSSMDEHSEQMVMELMRQLRDSGTTIIAISHNIRFRKLADNIVAIP